MPLIRVVTWNIRHGRRDDGVVDLDVVASTLRSLEADLIAVQEVDRGVSRSGGLDQAAILADHLGMDLAFARALDFDGGAYGHALLSRAALRDVEVVQLPRYDRDERRVALLARLGDAAVSIAAVHLQPSRRLERRPPSAIDQLRTTLGAFGRRGGSRVLLGDLNLAASASEPELRAAGLHLIASPPSHPRARPRRALDVVAVAGLSATGVEVPAIGHSDHRPVVVDLALDAAEVSLP